MSKKKQANTPTDAEPRFVCTNWDPECTVQKHGTKRGDVKRKVKTRGKKYLNAEELLEKAKEYLAKGYEVYLSDAIRLYPCMTPDCKTMFVSSRTFGDFRNETLKDKKVTVKWCGQEVDGPEMAEEAQRRHEKAKAERIEITPDTMVTCPKCGNRFRVGQRRDSSIK